MQQPLPLSQNRVLSCTVTSSLKYHLSVVALRNKLSCQPGEMAVWFGRVSTMEFPLVSFKVSLLGAAERVMLFPFSKHDAELPCQRA